jgi:hypothetical protein
MVQFLSIFFFFFFQFLLGFSKVPVFLCHPVYFGSNEIHCIFKTCCIISVFISTKCRSFHNFIYLCSNNTQVYHKPCKVKVKWTLVQALRLCTGCMAHRRSRGIALPFHNHSTRGGWVVSVTPRPLFTPGKDPVPIIQEAGWAPGPVWIGA